MRLSEKEIEKRLTRLRNLEGMYARQVSTNRKLKEENKRLKARIVELEKENKELKDRLEGLELVVEELKTLNFMGAREDELNKIYQSFDELTNSVDQEPEKLTNLRKSLLKNKEKYFTCLYHK